MIQKITEYIKNHKKISIAVAVGVVLVSVFMIRGGKTSAEKITVTKGDVVQQVIVTGKVKPADDVDLAFEKPGKVRSAYVAVGSKVVVGQTLVALDSGEIYADYLKAQANVETEQATLDALNRGSRPEEIAVSEAEVTNATIALANAEDKVKTALYESYTKSDDAIRNTIDSLFSNPRTNPQINIPVNDTQLKNDINQSRGDIEALLVAWDKNPTDTSHDSIVVANDKLNQVKAFVDKVASAVNALSANSAMSQTTVDGYKASVSTARTTLLGAQNSLSTAEEKLNTAKSTLLIAQKNLALKKSGSTPEDIKAQEARVLQAKANLQSTGAQLEKYTLKSPITGIVTKQDAKVGEIVQTGTPVVSVISNTKLEIEANVSEISIGKVAVGNKVDVTMDAFPGQVFSGTVSYVDPGETLVDGVVNFKVTITFDQEYPEIKTGLSANLTIKTNSKSGVLRIPQYALIKKDDGNYVSRLVGKDKQDIKVETGLVGNDGFVEVVQGLTEGDVVVISSDVKK